MYSLLRLLLMIFVFAPVSQQVDLSIADGNNIVPETEFVQVDVSMADGNDLVPETEAVFAVNKFAIDIYKQVAAGSGNIFFSPYSISSALAMTYGGANGDTAAEMAKVLHFGDDESTIHVSMNSLRERYDAIPKEQGVFSVANRLWLDEREKLIPAYSELVKDYYGAIAGTADFLNAYDNARLEINDWVAQKTRDKIKDLLQDGDINAQTLLVLVNAVYFNSEWLLPFVKSATKEEPFRTGKGKQINVPMMRQTNNFLYSENADVQWVRIPYKIPGYYLNIFLPRENESFTQLEEFEEKLSVGALAAWIMEAQYCEVNLIMPKFKDEQRYALAEILKKLGMKLAFGEEADFSRLVENTLKGGRGIHIDTVIHQAFIELDEERTEAAAATAVGMRTTAMPIRTEPVEFRADHPFVYCLTDANSTILFMGRMALPK